jgi:uncharacterized protein (TIGR00255 family)
MLLSMTGFASKTFTLPTDAEAVSITISIKSLNSRFFESTFKLPYALSFLETDLLQLCKSKLTRGHIFFNINISNPNAFKAAVEPSKSVVQSYLAAITTIKKSFKVGGEITIAELIQLPNIFAMEEKGVDSKTKKTIIDATNEVLEELLKVRAAEGSALKKDIEKRCVVLTKAINELEKISNKVMTDRKKAINQQLKDFGSDKSELADSQRAALYNELNKIDIHEEIVRFQNHLHNLKNLLQTADVEKGKRIDFTLQELSREINTVAAKGSDASMGALAINVKVELEKIREQIQNVV